jgi:hypothetical protein
MRRLDLSEYTVIAKALDPSTDKLAERTERYNVAVSVVNVLFAGGAEGRELLKRDAVAQKIEAATAEGSVLLEDAEFKLIETAFAAFKRFGRNEVELVKRVENAERVNLRDLKDNPPPSPAIQRARELIDAHADPPFPGE